MSKHIVVFSHGFGVQQDARGLFTDIARVLPNVESVMFDYNTFDAKENTVTVRPLREQAKILEEKIQGIRKIHPDAIVDIICHSQGAIAPALTNLEGMNIRRVIFLAPPESLNFERMLQAFQSRPGTTIDMGGVSRLARRDGSFTLVPKEYFEDRKTINPMKLYGHLSEKTELVIVIADQDEILGETDFSLLSRARIVHISGDHNFTEGYREGLVESVKKEVL